MNLRLCPLPQAFSSIQYAPKKKKHLFFIKILDKCFEIWYHITNITTRKEKNSTLRWTVAVVTGINPFPTL